MVADFFASFFLFQSPDFKLLDRNIHLFDFVVDNVLSLLERAKILAQVSDVSFSDVVIAAKSVSLPQLLLPLDQEPLFLGLEVNQVALLGILGLSQLADALVQRGLVLFYRDDVSPKLCDIFFQDLEISLASILKDQTILYDSVHVIKFVGCNQFLLLKEL